MSMRMVAGLCLWVAFAGLLVSAVHWIGDYDTNGTPIQQAIWMDDLPIGLRTAAAGTLSYIEPDHLGSPRVVVDPVADKAIWKWDLKGEAFGATDPEQDPDADGVGFQLNMRFPGQRYDAASGLNQNGFRDYDTGGGRYVESDPFGLEGGISTYAYVRGNPTNLIDPWGLLDVQARRFLGGEYRGQAIYGDLLRSNQRSAKRFQVGANEPIAEAGQVF